MDFLTSDFDLPKEEFEINSQQCMFKCIIQLKVLDLLQEMQSVREAELIKRMLSILSQSYRFTHKFNRQYFLRYCLWKQGSMGEHTRLPGLLK